MSYSTSGTATGDSQQQGQAARIAIRTPVPRATPSKGMNNALAAIAIIGTLALCLLFVFLIQSFVAPRILAGTLSEPAPQNCISETNQQWIYYDCLPNAITGLGCIVPGSSGTAITKKRIAVLTSPCIAQPGSPTYPGTRVITFVWQVQGVPSPCTSPPTTLTATSTTIPGGPFTQLECCLYDDICYRSVKYLCRETAAGPGGENQCLPGFLPVPYPEFDSGLDYTLPENEFTLNIPCNENFCETLPLIVPP